MSLVDLWPVKHTFHHYSMYIRSVYGCILKTSFSLQNIDVTLNSPTEVFQVASLLVCIPPCGSQNSWKVSLLQVYTAQQDSTYSECLAASIFQKTHLFSSSLFLVNRVLFLNTRVHSEGVWFSCYIVGAPTPLNKWQHSNEQALSPKLEHIMLPCSIYNWHTWHL